MVKKTSVSKKFSLDGWDYKKWIKGNAESIKIVISAVVTISIYNPSLIPVNLSIGAGAIIVKAVIDVIDFYSKEVQL